MMHINTKVVFEWNPESNEYAEVYSEGFEYEGDVAQCQYTSPGGGDQEQIQAALEQYGVDPSAYGLTAEQMYSLFSQGGGGIADIFGVQGGEYFSPFNVSQFGSGLQGIGRQRQENIQLGTENIRSRMFPGIKKAMGRTGGFAGGGAQQSFLGDIMGGSRQEYGQLQSTVGREYQGQLGSLFGGLEGWLEQQYGVAAGLNPLEAAQTGYQPSGATGAGAGGGGYGGSTIGGGGTTASCILSCVQAGGSYDDCVADCG